MLPRRSADLLDLLPELLGVIPVEPAHGAGEVAWADDRRVHLRDAQDAVDVVHGLDVLDHQDLPDQPVGVLHVPVVVLQAVLQRAQRVPAADALRRVAAGLHGLQRLVVAADQREDDAVRAHVQHALHHHLIVPGDAHEGGRSSRMAGHDVLLHLLVGEGGVLVVDPHVIAARQAEQLADGCVAQRGVCAHQRLAAGDLCAYFVNQIHGVCSLRPNLRTRRKKPYTRGFRENGYVWRKMDSDLIYRTIICKLSACVKIHRTSFGTKREQSGTAPNGCAAKRSTSRHLGIYA